MPKEGNPGTSDDGVLGLDVMAKGIWKIDFRKEELNFVSDLDSLDHLTETEIFPAAFTDHSIEVKVVFGKNNAKTMAVDLGYNGDMLMPLEEFERVSKSGKVFQQPGRFRTPAGFSLVTQHMMLDTVNIGHNWFTAMVTSHETVKERLIGLAFFRRFAYVIFDFLHQQVLVPKKIW